ncbi:MAG TPA: hypothetical protein PKL15_21720, partial [Saprospiraceae bacterium]|nr:hypothetical protein [Saprospiraceae bacterium]
MSLAALPFLAGIVLIQQLPSLPGDAALLTGVLLAGLLAWRRCGMGFLFMLGALWAVVFAGIRLSERLPATLEGSDIRVQGSVSGLPEVKDKSVRFNLAVIPL